MNASATLAKSKNRLIPKSVYELLRKNFVADLDGDGLDSGCGALIGLLDSAKTEDAGVKAHKDGNHAESEKLLNQALQLFKS